MGDGLSAYTAGKMLGFLAGTTVTPPSGVWAQLHTGPPGSAGTSNVSSVTTRQAVTLSVAGAVLSASGTLPVWTNWAGTNGEIVTDLSLWDASTSGNFLHSFPLTASPLAFTGTSASPCVLTAPGTAFAANAQVLLQPVVGESLPAGLSAGVIYFVSAPSGAAFSLAATSGGTAINSTAAGAGLAAAASPQQVFTGNNLQLSSFSFTLPTSS